MSCRRATSDTTAPGAQDSATIRPLASTLHRRRRPTPTRISIRPRGSEASTIWSTICANRSVQVGSHLATQATRYKVGAELRLRRIPQFVEGVVSKPAVEIGGGFVDVSHWSFPFCLG